MIILFLTKESTHIITIQFRPTKKFMSYLEMSTFLIGYRSNLRTITILFAGNVYKCQ